jgi:hypothetical protein
LRRCLRVGKRFGQPVEDLGVVPDQRHELTRRDLLEDNADLMEFTGSLLAKRRPAGRVEAISSIPDTATANMTSLTVGDANCR